MDFLVGFTDNPFPANTQDKEIISIQKARARMSDKDKGECLFFCV